MRLISCESTEKCGDVNADEDNVMKFNDRAARGRGTEKKDWSEVQYFRCMKWGHTVRP